MRRSIRVDWLIWGVLTIGVVLRLRQFFFNRSLWFDEAMLAVNIVSRTWRGLLGHLDWNQHAPLGFLFAEKLVTTLIGPSDLALRVFPLACSLGVLWLSWDLGSRIGRRIGTFVMVTLVAFGDKLIYFSSEAKQYSSDVLVTAVLLVLALRAEERGLHPSDVLLLGAAGVVGIWFSHPVVFVLVGVGLFTLYLARLRGRRMLWGVVLMGVMWLATFSLEYRIALSASLDNLALHEFWSSYFMPFPPTSADDLRWFLHYPFHVFSDPLAFAFPGVAAFLCICGCLSLGYSPEERPRLILFLPPIVMTLAASAAQAYPFGLRLLLFLAPVLLLLIARGVTSLWSLSGRQSQVFAVAAFALLLLRPTVESLYHVGKPRMVEEVKPLLVTLKARLLPDDAIYVHEGAVPGFIFYSQQYGLPDGQVHLEAGGPDSRLAQFQQWLRQLPPGRRCWVLFSHFDPGLAERVIATYVQLGGREIARVSDVAAWAVLIERGAE